MYLLVTNPGAEMGSEHLIQPILWIPFVSINVTTHLKLSNDSSVSIATGYRLDGRGKISLFSIAPRPALGATKSPI
jgi:hypothetical protein